MEITVVGAGVSGLTTGIRLLEEGWGVKIMTEDVSPNTVSDVAAAWWYPFLVEPIEKTNRWASETFDELLRLKNFEGVECITLRKGREYLDEICEPPGWSLGLPYFRILDEDEIVGEYKFGWEMEAPVIEMNSYMPWLLNKFKKLGGTLELQKFGSIKDVSGDLIVNCSGLGAREFCSDEKVMPVRGQVIYIKQDPGFGRFDQQPETLTYTIPRRDFTVLGGTAQKGDWDETIRHKDTEYILSKCEALWPELDRNKIIGVAVGLRPSRDELRLEKEIISNKIIIHNYGHGGAGVTLSWGCADEVVRLLKINT
ncbi:MAG: FAD-dependent oxidoreductase [Candidatus Thalassarchaeaceae archaeon]|nr:FAD-dependent oxidoreductase [Candidatus Thalassarchaeaceae archaeon]